MSPLNGFHARSTAVASAAAVDVVCAWPVSGQYGPGSRILYYVLVATCILGRRVEWLRNAALAVALVFPAVAALHALVLAALHVDDAVDMDIYGAFQLCTIGILAAPTTVRLSRTYQDASGRNTIFLWTGLVVTGLLSLVVEFYRANPVPCLDGDGKPLVRNGENFPYGKASMCSLTCSEEEGPFSPMRGGAARNIYVIPAPKLLRFDTALLIAAACCIPAILSVAFTLIQILDNNWKRRFEHEVKNEDDPISGTNGATIRQMTTVNEKIRSYQNYIEVPFFGAAVLAILILGELNFFSEQVRYMTEPMASIGQWAPIAGTMLAVFGSLYLIIARKMEGPQETASSEDGDTLGPMASHDFGPLQTRRTNDTSIGRVASAINNFGDKLGSATHKKLDDSNFKLGEARDFPMIPGEVHRNPNLPHIQELYNPPRDAKGDVSPEFRAQRSRSNSFTNLSVSSGLGISGLEPSPGPSTPVVPARRNTLEVPSPAFHRT